jgi:hypothetical protein
VHRSGVHSQVAISWILTWFAHDVDDFPLVSRIYDACIASHPLFAVYIAAALIESKEDEILAAECEFTELHKLLSAVGLQFTLPNVSFAFRYHLFIVKSVFLVEQNLPDVAVAADNNFAVYLCVA